MADVPSICILMSLQNKNANMQTSHRVPIKSVQMFTEISGLHLFSHYITKKR